MTIEAKHPISNDPISRRMAFRRIGTAVAASAFACIATTAAQAAGTGPCTYCACPGFLGAGSYPLVCQRCSHPWTYHR